MNKQDIENKLKSLPSTSNEALKDKLIFPPKARQQPASNFHNTQTQNP